VKQTVEDRAHAEALRREQAVAREKESRVLVGHGERVTVHAIAGAKVALEVRGPEIIGLGGLDRHDAGMLVVVSPAAFLHQPLARQEVSCRADGRETDSRMARAEPVQELVRPPARVPPTGVADQRRHRLGDFVRAPPRRPAAIAESFTPALIESVQPLVARFPTNAVPRTQFGHGVQGQPVIANEAFSLFHRCSLQPGHRSNLTIDPQRTGCHPCSRFILLPMYPVCTACGLTGRWSRGRN
jgi:hypothetical protein